MNIEERLLSIRLIEKIQKNEMYAKKLGIEIKEEKEGEKKNHE